MQENVWISCTYSFLALITRLARVTAASASLIDNIFCNSMVDFYTLPGLLFTDKCDHFPVFCVSKQTCIQQSSPYMKKWNYCQANIDQFIIKLNNCDWSPIMTMNDCQRGIHLVFHIPIEPCATNLFHWKNCQNISLEDHGSHQH